MTVRSAPSTSLISRRRLAVAAGGALGAVGRWTVTETIGAAGIDLLWATFAVNTLGSLFLGFVVAYHTGRSRSSPLMIPFVAVGILGAFTTFSLLSAEVMELLRAGSWGLALAYPLGTIIVGFGAALLGVRFGAAR
ncbi:MAG: CrcB family protein [Actinomycetota bacterium]